MLIQTVLEINASSYFFHTLSIILHGRLVFHVTFWLCRWRTLICVGRTYHSVAAEHAQQYAHLFADRQSDEVLKSRHTTLHAGECLVDCG